MGSRTIEEQKGWVIKKMFDYASDTHKSYLNDQAFADIASVFLDFMYCEKSMDMPTRWVCNAPMGHGKTTVLRSLCRYLITHNIPNRNKKAILIVIKEKGEGKIIADELMELGDEYKGKIRYITSDNRVEIPSSEIKRAQIVIITHQRFKQLVLGCGDIDIYSQWEIHERNKVWGNSHQKEKYNAIYIPRHIIIDEMPDFENTSVFDIGSTNNCINWFDTIVKLPEMKKLIDDDSIQSYRKLFNEIFIGYTYNKNTDTTYKFLNDSMPEEKEKDVTKFYEMVCEVDDLQNKITLETYTDFVNYRKLLYNDEAGKIYHQYHNRGGEKIIVSDFVPYDNIFQQYYIPLTNSHETCAANILVLDGTGRYGTACYKPAKFEPRFVKNYNDYNRLTLHHRAINTSSDSRGKESTVLKDILCDFASLQKQNSKIFLLPAKNDIPFLLKQDELSEENFRALTIDEKAKDGDTRLHILNTRGKNDIKDVVDMYMTCLPRKAVLTYATLAVALYGTKVDIRLRKNVSDDDSSKNKNAQWFNNDKVELLYLVDLVAELLQIIHRTALRKIKSKEKINIYIAFEDIKNEDEDICRIFGMMRSYFTLGTKAMEKDAKYTYLEVYNGSIYGRNKKIERFASEIKKIMEAHDVCEIKLSKKTLGGLGNELTQFFKANDNWNNNKEAIIDRFEKSGLHLSVKSERVKIFSVIKVE